MIEQKRMQMDETVQELSCSGYGYPYMPLQQTDLLHNLQDFFREAACAMHRTLKIEAANLFRLRP